MKFNENFRKNADASRTLLARLSLEPASPCTASSEIPDFGKT